MTGREIVKLIPDHLLNMDIRNHDNKFIKSYGIDRFISVVSMYPAYTLLVNDNPVLCGGIFVMCDGVGEVWTVTSKAVEKYPLSFHKTVVYTIEKFREFYKLHRIQATCLKEHNVSRKWLEHLGFKCEGLLEKYDMEKRDYYMFARVF